MLNYKFASDRYHLPHIQDIHPSELEEFMEARRFMIAKTDLTDAIRDEVTAIVTQSREDPLSYSPMTAYHSPQLRERIDLYLKLAGKKTTIVPRMGREFHMEYLLLIAAYVDPGNMMGWKFTVLPSMDGDKGHYLPDVLKLKKQAMASLTPKDGISYKNPNIPQQIGKLRAFSIELRKAEFMNLYYGGTKRFQKPLEKATIEYFEQLERCADSLFSDQAKKHALHGLPVKHEPKQFIQLELAFGFDYLWPGYSDSYFEHNGIESLLTIYNGLIRKKSSELLSAYDSVRKREIERKVKVNRFSCHKEQHHTGRYIISDTLKILNTAPSLKTATNSINLPTAHTDVESHVKALKHDEMDQENM